MKPTPAKEIIQTVVTQLTERFKNIKVGTHDPKDYFEDFFCDGGTPFGDKYYPIWEDKGAILALKGEDLSYWDRVSAQIVKRNQGKRNLVIFLLREDGVFGEVDQRNGRFFKLTDRVEPEVLAEFVQLFFEQGRRELSRPDRPSPQLIKTYHPFPRKPEDLSEDQRTMPIVSSEYLLDVLYDHARNVSGWLSNCYSLDPLIKNYRKAAREAMQPDPDDPSKLIETEDSSYYKGYAQILRKEEKKCKKWREDLYKKAAELPENVFLDQPLNPKHSFYWDFSISWLSIDGEELAPFIPVILSYNDGVFSPYIRLDVQSSTYNELYKHIANFKKTRKVVDLPYSFDLPPYLDQVELTLYNDALRLQLPELAKRVMRTDLWSEQTAIGRLAHRRLFWNAMQAIPERPFSCRSEHLLALRDEEEEQARIERFANYDRNE